MQIASACFLLDGETEKMGAELVRTRCYSYICSGISSSKTVRLHACCAHDAENALPLARMAAKHRAQLLSLQ